MKKNGFTLIELLMVLFLMGLLMSVAVLRFDFFQQMEEKQELRTVASQIRYGRNQAIASGSTVRIYFQQKPGKELQIIVPKAGKNEVYKLGSLDFPLGSYTLVFKKTGAPSEGKTLLFKGNNKEYAFNVGIGTGYLTWKEK